MALRSNHYDVAFEEYLRGRKTPHVVVDETRRALLCEASLKSMDFIVHAQQGPNLLVDVKGRRFPSGNGTARHKWENWATADDLDSLLKWQHVFGGDFRALLVFAYNVVESGYLTEVDNPFVYRDRCYAFYGVWADEYRPRMRTRSPSWETVALRARDFRELCAPVDEFL